MLRPKLSEDGDEETTVAAIPGVDQVGRFQYKDIKVKSIRLNQERVNASNNVEKKKDEEEPNLERTTFNETLVQMHFTSWLF